MLGLKVVSAVINYTNSPIFSCAFKRGTTILQKHFFSSNRKAFHRVDNKVSLVIFDKDGTIVAFGAGWDDCSITFARRLEEATGLVFEDKLLTLLGYNAEMETWKEGLLCDNPRAIQQGLLEFLQMQGVSKDAAKSLLLKEFKPEAFLSDMKKVKIIDNPLALFKTIKHFGIKTAICTSDSKMSTSQLFDKLPLNEVTDYILCGDHPDFQTKPNPQNIYHICEKLNVPVNKTVMIGDTTRDVDMGKAARVQRSIGVLCGVCERHELVH